MFNHVLIVCVGNICRSPMAAALFADRLRALKGIRIESAGIAALEGRPAEPEACTLMAERGLDLSHHRARQLTPRLAEQAQLVLVMEKSHVRDVETIAPLSRGRVHRLGHFGDFEVPDPYRQGRRSFEQALALIERGIEEYDRAFWRKCT